MKWKRLNVAHAAKMQADLRPGQALEILPEEYEHLRSMLMEKWSRATRLADDSGIKQGYEYKRDLHFGMDLYEIFSQGEFAMSLRVAADPDVWRYISLKVAPEIVFARWQKESSWPDRFYKKPNRIYLKVLWWYIYLSWQGSRDDTLLALENNSEDTIAQLVERSGAHGYWPELYRSIMRRLFLCGDAGNMALFRKIMKLHTARVVTTEPEMVTGGVPGYVEGLFEYFNKK